MRIGIDATALPPLPAGASRYLTNLVQYLAKTDSDNEYFIFLKRTDAGLFPLLPENFRLMEVAGFARPARLMWELHCPAHYARRLQLDLWHAPHYIIPNGLDGCRLIVTFHDLTFFLFPQFYGRVKRSCFQGFIRKAVGRADSVISVSKSTHRDLIELFPEVSGRVATVYSGVDERFCQSRLTSQSDCARERFAADAPYLLFVGTLERRKNVPTLVAAYAELVRATHLPHHLVLVGQPGNDSANVSRRIAASGLQERIHLTGHVAENELEALYSGADLFVFPSFYEGFAFPVLEAMASGVPTLCANAGATAEVAQHPDRFFDPADVDGLADLMHRALSSTVLRRRLEAHGRCRAIEFPWYKTATATREVYEQVGSARNRPSGSVFNSQFDDGRTLPQKGSPEPSAPKGGKEEIRGDDLIPFSVPSRASGDTESVRDLSRLNDAVLRTLVYADIFDYPLYLEELHRSLIGHRATPLDVRESLSTPKVSANVGSSGNCFFLQGKQDLTVLRSARRRKTESLLQCHRRLLRLVCSFPFVRAVALSGALAFENANGRDDIDLFLIVDGSRTWSTYIGLALLMKLLGKRRTVCLNYVEGRGESAVPERNFFVAHQIAHLRPLSGNGYFNRFWAANRWIAEYLPQAETPKPALAGFYDPSFSSFQRSAERILSGELFNCLERAIFRVYGGRLTRITRHLEAGVEISDRRIMLFTNDHLPRTMAHYYDRLREIQQATTQEFNP